MNTQSTLPLETGRGFVDVWECDENAHYNVQFYMARKSEADAHLRLALGLPSTNRPGDPYWVHIDENHVRYHGELRAVDSLVLHSGIAEIDETHFTIIHEMHNAVTGALSATFVTRWTCLTHDYKGVQSNTWPVSVINAAEKLRIPIPSHAKKYSTGVHGPVPDITLVQAKKEGMALTHRCLVLPSMTDASGCLTEQHITSISSDSAAQLWQALDYDWADLIRQGKGTVVLEALTQYRLPLHAGDATLTLSHTIATTAKALSFGHLLFNAETSSLCAAIEITAVVFDLKQRKVIPLELKDSTRFAALKPSYIQSHAS